MSRPLSVPAGCAGPRSLLLAAFLVVAGCAAGPDDAEQIDWSATWFQCDGSFECIAVYDAYCKYTAVNTRYALVYQDWARQRLVAVGELRPCDSAAEHRPLAAYCRGKRCAYP